MGSAGGPSLRSPPTRSRPRRRAPICSGICRRWPASSPIAPWPQPCAPRAWWAFPPLFNRAQKYMHLQSSLHPKWKVWKRIVAIGLPATGEFALIFITTAVAYWAIRRFGPQAQAGYGIGARTMQAIFLPAMAVAFATGPIAGQNFGARNAQRVRDTFRHAAVIGGAIMLGVTLLCQISPHLLVAPFSDDPAVVDVATEFLRIASWNFVAVGLTFCCSGMFQALGDTKPALLSSASRLLTYVVPAIWLSGQS